MKTRYVKKRTNRDKSNILQVRQILTDRRATSQAMSSQTSRGGLPAQLRAGIEKLAGASMEDVRVHYNSPRPAQLGAHAYTAGNQIHLGRGQEKHLPHEAWHVVQQKQGRVQPTFSDLNQNQINDDAALEREADIMGQKSISSSAQVTASSVQSAHTISSVIQAKMDVSNVNQAVHGNLDIKGFHGLNNGQGPASITVQAMQGTSAPADPQGMVASIRPYLKDPSKSNVQTLTRMHAIRGRFGGPSSSNNMFLGTALSNNFSSNSHYHQVEKPLEDFIRGKPKGQRAFDYRVYPNVGVIPGYMGARIDGIQDGAIQNKLEVFARRHVPDGFHCEATLYDGITANGYKQKHVAETVQTTVGVSGAKQALPGAGLLATAHDSGLLHGLGAALTIGLLPVGIGFIAGALGYTAIAAAAGAFSGYHALAAGAAGGLHGYMTADHD